MTRQRKHPRAGVFLLPNLFTTGALFAGFYAIVAAMSGRFVAAAVAIFIAMVLDGLDGRIARLTNTQSAFGAEYDSLSDMVSFGLAPSLIMYEWALFSLGKIGWLAAFTYTACAALRLARFNTQVGVADKRFFQGLASPASAAIVAGSVWMATHYGLSNIEMRWVAFFITVSSALLMVSKFRYTSFKGIDFRKRVPFIAILLLVLAFVLISLRPTEVLFGAFVLYALSGPAWTLWHRQQHRARRRRERKQSEG